MYIVPVIYMGWHLTLEVSETMKSKVTLRGLEKATTITIDSNKWGWLPREKQVQV